MYQVFIPSLFYKQTKQSEDLKPWVTNFVNDNINKLSSVFIKTDGSNKPTTDIDFNQNTITNLRESSNINDPIVRKELDTTNKLADSMFEQKSTPLAIKSVATNSEYGGNNDYGKVNNLIDNNPNSQWMINKANVDSYVFVLLELNQPTRIYKLELYL